MRRGLGALAIGLPLLLLLPTVPGGAAAAASQSQSQSQKRDPIEFWFVEANEGLSAAGHAAIRIGDRVYHLEHRGDGLIADRRTSPTRFDEIYRLRGNRRVDAIPLALEPLEAAALEARLEARFFERRRQLDRLDALESGTRWLEAALAQGYLSVEVPGLGLFATGPPSCAALQPAHFTQFRSELALRHGQGWLELRRAAARLETQRVMARLLGHPEQGPRTAPEARDAGPGGAIRRLTQAAQTWAAFEVVLGCRPLRPDAMSPAATPLGAGRTSFVRTRDRLVARLHGLMQSNRGDVGLPILLAWARWAALEESLATGQVHLLDPFVEGRSESESGTPSRPPESIDGELPEHWIPMFEAEAERRWLAALGDLEADHGPLEAQLSGLERAHHARRHTRLRTLHRTTPPTSSGESASRRYVSADRILPWPVDLPFSTLAVNRDAARAAARTQRQFLEAELDYDLLTRNCVTELLAALRDSSAHASLSPIGTGSNTAFGRLIRGEFIPEVAARRIERNRSAGPRRSRASAREAALARTHEHARSPWFGLREATTLTSRSYEPNAADSSFLFFSDGPLWARPLFGIANLGYGLAAATVGLFEAPFDAGVRLRRGLQGALMSVPEVFFFQVRQGSYRVSPPRELVQRSD